MTKIIFSGINKTFFNTLTFSSNVDVNWLPIDELSHFTVTADCTKTKFVLFYTAPEAFLAEDGHKAILNTEIAELEWAL